MPLPSRSAIAGFYFISTSSPQFVKRVFEAILDVAVLELLDSSDSERSSDSEADDGADGTGEAGAQCGAGDGGAENDFVAGSRRSGAILGGVSLDRRILTTGVHD